MAPVLKTGKLIASQVRILSLPPEGFGRPLGLTKTFSSRKQTGSLTQQSFLSLLSVNLVPQLSWLERGTHKPKVTGSNPVGTTKIDSTYTNGGSIFFVRSGYSAPAARAIRTLGAHSYSNSRITADSAFGGSILGAYAIEVADTELSSSHGPANRFNGFPIRCLAY